jgi:hypothetical protein
MVRICPNKKHEVTNDGLCVFVEGPSSLALTSPEAQRMVFNYVKESGLQGYGMNKFIPNADAKIEGPYSFQGHWLLLPSQWNRNSIRV